MSNTWIIWPLLGDNSGKPLLIPHELTGWHRSVRKDLLVKDESASD